MSDTTGRSPPAPAIAFPTHNSPRTWFITSAFSPLAVRLIRRLLAHGDYVAAGLPAREVEGDDRGVEFKELIDECKSGRADREGWGSRIMSVICDGRTLSNAQSALAEAVSIFKRVDILLCNNSESVVGGVEELSTSPATRDLVYRQFNTNFFGPSNFVRAAIPILREKNNGHIIILTSVAGHIGTPGMPVHCSAVWALEGLCDSIAYEIAPFNIKLTIVQPSKEVSILTNKIIFAPQLPAYSSDLNPAPSIRDMLTSALTRTSGMSHSKGGVSEKQIISSFPTLRRDKLDELLMETVYALAAIGGHENPPARHVVGHEGVIAVKEKLRTVNEELEEFHEASLAADILPEDELPSQISNGDSFVQEKRFRADTASKQSQPSLRKGASRVHGADIKGLSNIRGGHTTS